MEARGNISFRGFGKMKTFILLGNRHATEAQLTGRENFDDLSSETSPHSLSVTPTTERRNKVCPTEDASISDGNYVELPRFHY